MFRSISHLVDVPQELYYSNAQYSLIRITSRVFAIYVSGLEIQLESETTASSGTKDKQLQKQADEAAVKEKINRFIGSKDRPIFLSNIVNFRCNNIACPYQILENTAIPDRRGYYFGQVQAIIIDYRSVRLPRVDEGDIVIKIREILLSRNLQITIILALVLNKQFINDKYIFVLVKNIVPTKVGVLMYYAFQAIYRLEDLLKGNPPRFVRRIVRDINRLGNTPSIRLVQQDDPVRSELELNYFSQKQLVSKFYIRKDGIVVTSMPLYFYIDAFRLYRNMYRALIGVYLFIAILPNKERGRRANIIPLTLGLYSYNLTEVIDAIGAIVSTLDTRVIIELVDSTKIIVYTQILTFIGNILQQQLNTSFLSQKAKFGCRSYIRDIKIQSNLDIKVDEQRYYYDTIRTRTYLETYTFRIAKAKSDFIQNVSRSIKLELRPLERIAPALLLDLKIGTLANIVYSKIQGLAKRIYLLLKDAILTNIAIKQYYFLLTTFLLLGNWQVL